MRVAVSASWARARSCRLAGAQLLFGARQPLLETKPTICETSDVRRSSVQTDAVQKPQDCRTLDQPPGQPGAGGGQQALQEQRQEGQGQADREETNGCGHASNQPEATAEMAKGCPDQLAIVHEAFPWPRHMTPSCVSRGPPYVGRTFQSRMEWNA